MKKADLKERRSLSSENCSVKKDKVNEMLFWIFNHINHDQDMHRLIFILNGCFLYCLQESQSIVCIS